MGQGQSLETEEDRKAEELERQRLIQEGREKDFKGYLVQTGSKGVAIAFFTTCICLSLSVWYRTIAGKEPKPLFGVGKIHLDRKPTGSLNNVNGRDGSSSGGSGNGGSSSSSSSDENDIGAFPSIKDLTTPKKYDLEPMTTLETTTVENKEPPQPPLPPTNLKQIPGVTVSQSSNNAAAIAAIKQMKEKTKKEQKKTASKAQQPEFSGNSAVVPFSLTYVMYNPSDPYGEVMALITLAPIFIVVMYATLIIMRRDVGTMLVFLGQLIGVAINVIVKKAIKEPRPDGAHLEDEGMPSNHAQFIFFFAVFYTLELLFRSPRKVCPYFLRLFYSMMLFALAVTVSFSRVYLNYHTFEQVLVGAGLGALNASIWSFVCKSKIIICMCEYACRTWLFQFLAIRNYSEIEYCAVEEYIAMTGYVSSLQNLPNYSKTSNAGCCGMSASSVGSYIAERKGHEDEDSTTLDNSKSNKSHYSISPLSLNKPLGPTSYSRLRQRDKEKEKESSAMA